MMFGRHISSILLLTIYWVVLGHSFVAHHHHEQNPERDYCAVEVEALQHHHHAGVETTCCCDHTPEQSTPCHFEVNPVRGKVLELDSALPEQIVFAYHDEVDQEPMIRPCVDVPVPENPAHICRGLRGPPVIA